MHMLTHACSVPALTTACELMLQKRVPTCIHVSMALTAELLMSAALSRGLISSAHEAAKALAAGLQDRSPKAQSAAQKMLQSWLKSSCDGNPVALLQHLDVVANEGEPCRQLNASQMHCLSVQAWLAPGLSH